MDSARDFAIGVGLFPSHSLCVDFSLDDLVSRLSREGHRPSELLTTAVTVEVAIGEILGDALDEALDQPAAPTFSVFIELCAAFGTVDGNRSTVYFLRFGQFCGIPRSR